MVIYQKHILVPLNLAHDDLKALYQTLALAERIFSKIVVLFHGEPPNVMPGAQVLRETCMDMIQSACEAGLDVCVHITDRDIKEELPDVVESEHIDLIIIGKKNRELEQIVTELLPKLPCQVLQVKGRGGINGMALNRTTFPQAASRGRRTP